MRDVGAQDSYPSMSIGLVLNQGYDDVKTGGAQDSPSSMSSDLVMNAYAGYERGQSSTVLMVNIAPTGPHDLSLTSMSEIPQDGRSELPVSGRSKPFESKPTHGMDSVGASRTWKPRGLQSKEPQKLSRTRELQEGAKRTTVTAAELFYLRHLRSCAADASGARGTNCSTAGRSFDEGFCPLKFVLNLVDTLIAWTPAPTKAVAFGFALACRMTATLYCV